jgi:hypothetical protein
MLSHRAKGINKFTKVNVAGAFKQPTQNEFLRLAALLSTGSRAATARLLYSTRNGVTCRCVNPVRAAFWRARNLVQHLADVRGVYLVGSSKRGCYKFGYNNSLRNGIGSHGFYPFKLDVIMWREIEDNKPLSEQLRAKFSAKSCRVDDTPGEWFKLSAADLEILKTEFQFISD